MSTSYGTFQVSQTVVKLPRQGGVITIVPFGDIHRESKNCDSDRWLRFLEKCKAEDTPHTYYIGMGDYNDFASYSERKQLRDLHDTTNTSMDELAGFNLASICDEIGFMKGKLLGLHHGNHEWEFQDGDLATEKMCEDLECPFLGYASHVSLNITLGRNRCPDLTIFGSHGKGGGRLLGSPYNSLEKMSDIFHDEDIYLMGHDHHKGTLSRTRLTVHNGIIKQKRQWFGRTGSFLKGWVKDNPSYVVGAMYSPTDLGTIKFECHIRRSQTNGIDTVMKDVHSWS